MSAGENKEFAFNRTIQELKYQGRRQNQVRDSPFNRTIQELKSLCIYGKTKITGL